MTELHNSQIWRKDSRPNCSFIIDLGKCQLIKWRSAIKKFEELEKGEIAKKLKLMTFETFLFWKLKAVLKKLTT